MFVQKSDFTWNQYWNFFLNFSGMGVSMNKFELDFDANELDIVEKPSPIQMMEPSLRTTVFVAQIQAGMWRRNGHSLIEQAMAYHDSR